MGSSMDKNTQIITLTILLGSIFLAFLGIGLIVPALPSLLNELNISGTIAGYLVAAFAIVQLISSPITGRLVDQFGRKPFIIIGLILFSISEFLFGLGRNVELLFIARMLGGLSGACIMPSVTAFIYDITPKEQLSKVLGYMSASITTGFIVGPGIGGFLSEYSIRLPFFVAGILGIIGAIVTITLLKEPTRKSHSKKGTKKTLLSTGWKRIFTPTFFYAFLLIFIASFGLAIFESLFSLFMDHKFSFTPKDIAIVITGGAIVGAISQISAFNYLVKKLGEIKIIRYSLLLSAIFTFLMTTVSTYVTILLTAFIIFLGFDLMRPAVTSYLAKIAEDDQGFVSGMNSAFTSIGNILGPILGGWLFDYNYNYPYYSATIILITGFIFSLFWKNRATI